MKQVIISLYHILLITSAVSYLTLHPIDQLIPEGGNVTFTCIFNISISEDDCSWQLNGVPVHIKHYYPNYERLEDIKNGNCSIAIRHVTITRDEGAWRCFIPRRPDYPNGILSNTAHLVVIVRPSLPNLMYDGINLTNNSVLKLTNEEKITIFCETSSGSPETNLYWKIGENVTLNGNTTFENEKENPRLKKTTNRLDLSIKPYLDLKNITCISKHYNARESISFQLNVSYATTSVKITSKIFTAATVGQNVNFVCEANGNPPPLFEWRFKPYSSNEWSAINRVSKFSLRATKSIDGQYLCIAGNNLGTAKWSSEVTVTVSDKVSRLLYNLIIPLVVCFVLAILVTISLVIYLRWRKRRKRLGSSEVSVARNDQSERRDKIGGSAINITTVYKLPPNSEYLKSRPLPKITPDEYIGFDPVGSGGLRGDKKNTCGQNRESNIYEKIDDDIKIDESPHIYKNIADISINRQH